MALLTCSCGAEDECVEQRSTISLDQPGPWGRTPTEVFSHAEGARVGSWEWTGGGDILDVSPASGQVAFLAELTLTGQQAVTIESTKRGTGRLTCVSRMEIPATLEIVTDDGGLNEIFEVTATADDSFGNLVIVTVDLGDVAINGSLAVELKDGVAFDDAGMMFVTRWDDNGAGLIRGMMFYGGQTSQAEGDATTGSGVVREFARFTGEFP